MTEQVNQPSHYTQGNIECIEAIEAALGTEGFVHFCRGQQIKYAWRAGLKGDTATDLEKAAWYGNRAAAAIHRAKAGVERVVCDIQPMTRECAGCDDDGCTCSIPQHLRVQAE